MPHAWFRLSRNAAVEIGSATVSVASSRPTRKRLPNNLFCSLAGWPPASKVSLFGEPFAHAECLRRDAEGGGRDDRATEKVANDWGLLSPRISPVAKNG